MKSLRSEFRTQRLHCRAASPADAERVRAAANESLAQLTPWLPWARQAQTAEQAAAYAAECAAGFAAGTLFDFNAYDLQTGDFVCKLAAWPVSGGPEVFEIGYWCVTRRAGHGYTGEAVEGLMRWALAELGIARFRIRLDEGNARSRRLAERLGFARVHQSTKSFFGEERCELVYERQVLA